MMLSGFKSLWIIFLEWISQVPFTIYSNNLIFYSNFNYLKSYLYKNSVRVPFPFSITMYDFLSKSSILTKLFGGLDIRFSIMLISLS